MSRPRREMLAASALSTLLAPWLALPAAPARAADAEPLLTLLSGEARILTPQGAWVAGEGSRLGGPALLQTSAETKLLRIEWPGGTALDLGPDSQLLLAPQGLADKPDRSRGTAYLLRGWVKLSAVAGEPAPLLLSLYAAVLVPQGATVNFVGNGQAWVFGESATPQITERPARGAPVSLAVGQFYSRQGSDPGAVQARPLASALREVPRSFRDKLPLRHAALRGKAVAARPGSPPSYAELRAWLGGETAVRRYLASHFSPLARDAALQAALLEHEKEHPEWSAVLHPERNKKP